MGLQEYVYNRLQFRYMGQLLLLLQTRKAYGLLPVLVWLRLFNTIQVSLMRISHFWIPVGYGYLMAFLFSIPFGSI